MAALHQPSPPNGSLACYVCADGAASVLALFPPQEVRCVMTDKSSESKQYSRWCLESTAQILGSKFPDAALWIMKPLRMFRNVFSVFEQFVPSSLTGVPDYIGSYGGVATLDALLTGALQGLEEKHAGVLPAGKDSARLSSLPVVLIGFSKGCVVLNQFVYEVGYLFGGVDLKDHGDPDAAHHSAKPRTSSSSQLHFSDADKEKQKSFLRQVIDWYWLDAGHSGSCGAWVTNESLLRHFAGVGGAGVHVHVTPHQVRCLRRPWIGEEERLFVDRLRQLGCKVEEKLHFEHSEISFENHFRVLEMF